MDEGLELVKDTLKSEKTNDKSLIPYYVSFIPEAPQYLILSYIPRYEEVTHEYVKIKPEGLMFHDNKFQSIKKLIAWFKSKLKTPEYQKYIEHMTPPAFDINNRRRTKEEQSSVKKESRDTKRERKREKDSVYKRPLDNVKRRNKRDEDEENKYRKRGDHGNYSRQGDNFDEKTASRDWNADWEGRASKHKMKKEGGQSRSRSRSSERKQKREANKGKKSVASKQSFNSDYLHNAWGTENQAGDGWGPIDDNQNEGWGNKSEIKTENDFGLGHNSTKNEEWDNWNDAKTHKTNEESNF